MNDVCQILKVTLNTCIFFYLHEASFKLIDSLYGIYNLLVNSQTLNKSVQDILDTCMACQHYLKNKVTAQVKRSDRIFLDTQYIHSVVSYCFNVTRILNIFFFQALYTLLVRLSVFFPPL